MIYNFFKIFYYGIMTILGGVFLFLILLALYRALTLYPKQVILFMSLIFGIGYIVNLIMQIIK